jgi:hypothetical protein
LSTSCSTSRIARPLAHKLRSDVEDAVDHHRRQAAGGFVQDQQLRVADHALRHRQDLLLAARQARGHLLAALGHLGEQRIDAIELAAVAVRRMRVGADQQVVLHRQAVEHAVALQHLHHAGLHDLARRQLRDVAAGEAHAAARLGINPDTACSSVLLPAPLRPRITTNSPLRTSSETPCTTSALP